jgi:hypothetical protein
MFAVAAPNSEIVPQWPALLSNALDFVIYTVILNHDHSENKCI